MIVYKDIFSGDEILSDSYPMKLTRNDCIWEVKASSMTESLDVDERAIGGNASADGPTDEGVDSSTISGINVVMSHKLISTNFTKKQYMTHIKDYCKRVVAKIEDDEEKKVFKTGMMEFVKEVGGDFEEYLFYIGESLDENAMTILMKYVGGGITPTLYFFKHGLVAEKC